MAPLVCGDRQHIMHPPMQWDKSKNCSWLKLYYLRYHVMQKLGHRGGANYAISWLLHKWFSQVFPLEILSSEQKWTNTPEYDFSFFNSNPNFYINSSWNAISFRLQCCSLLRGTSSSNQIMNTSQPRESLKEYSWISFSITYFINLTDWTLGDCWSRCWRLFAVLLPELEKMPVATTVTYSSCSVCHIDWQYMKWWVHVCYKNQCCTSYKHEEQELSVQCAMKLAA